MSEWAAKRFWTTVSLAPLMEGYTILLDGKPIKTPLRNNVIIPTEAIAMRIMAEWAAQEEVIVPHTMPITRLMNTAIDRVHPQRGEIISQLLAYIPTDTLCFVTPIDPNLRAQQTEVWTPIILWAQGVLGCEILQTETFSPPVQAYTDTVKARLELLTDLQLSCLHECVTLTGSILLGLAVVEHAFSTQALWDASILEEIHQQAQWGTDQEAKQAQQNKRRDFMIAADVLSLC